MIAIFYALKNEIDHFKRSLNIIRQNKIQKATFIEAEIDNIHFLLVQTGVGVNASIEAINLAIENYSIDLIISTGFTGALKDKIAIGDMVHAKQILYAKDLESIDDQKPVKNLITQSIPDYSKVIEKVCKELELQYHYGDTITVEKVVSDASKKNWLGKNSTAISVDMETFPLAEMASNKNIPIISIRSVSDDVETDLQLENMSDFLEDGEVNLKKASWSMVKNFQNVPNMLKLRKQAIIASRNISKILLYIIKNLVKTNMLVTS